MLDLLPFGDKQLAAMRIARIHTVAVVDIDVVAPAVMVFRRLDATVRRRADRLAVGVARGAARAEIDTLMVGIAVPTAGNRHVRILQRADPAV